MFRLLRYFSLTSAVTLLAVIIVLSLLYRQNAVDDLVQASDLQNAALATSLANSIWPRFGSYIGSVTESDGDVLRARPETRQIGDALAELIAGLPILKIKIYNSRGLTVFSTDPRQIGDDFPNNSGFLAARRGEPANEFSPRQKFSFFSGEKLGRDIVESYVPVRKAAGSIGGVFEIYSDVTPLVARIDRTTTKLVVGLLVVFALLYGTLYAIVRHADVMLRRQYADLANSEQTIRDKNSALESEIVERKKTESALQAVRDQLELRVALRTTELVMTNENLSRENAERKAAELALGIAKGEAEHANQAKSRFLAAASHDLRQPLQTLVIYMALLSKQVTDDEHREIVSLMQQSLVSIQELLKALLDISKLEAGVITPEIEDFPLAGLLQRLASEFGMLAAEKGLEFRAVPTRLVVRSSQGLLESILRNLLSNAVVHSTAGRVLIGCRRRPGHARIEIWDTGPGIEKEQLETVFDEFVQLDNPAGDRSKGMGLGLTIVDRTAQLLGYRIDVASRPGKGSMFAVEVPLSNSSGVVAALAEAPVIGSDLAGRGIVVIEDDPTVQMSLRRMLEHWGCGVTAEASAEKVLAILAKGQSSPDLIIADFRLADGKNGDEAIRQVRQYFDTVIPGLIVTGDTAPDRLSNARRSGFQILHKPVAPDELYLVVLELLRAS